jgi:hypothetical protein
VELCVNDVAKKSISTSSKSPATCRRTSFRHCDACGRCSSPGSGPPSGGSRSS